MAVFLSVADLQPFEPDIDPGKAQEMIDDATALAVLAAPCIDSGTFTNVAAVKAILRGAILRWNEAGTGALQAQQAGPFGQTLDTRQQRRGMFWPSEIVQLQSLCSGGSSYTTSLAGPDRVEGYWAQPNLWVPYVPEGDSATVFDGGSVSSSGGAETIYDGGTP